MDWFIITVLATLIYGTMNFSYKIAASAGCSSNRVLNAASLTVSLISLTIILFNYNITYFDNTGKIILFALINGTFFGIGNLSKQNALKHIPANLAFPISKLNAVFVIIISIFIFSEEPNMSQYIGIFFSFVILFILQGSRGFNNEKISIKNIGFLFALLSAVCTAISITTGKIAASEVNKLTYICLSYFIVFIYTTIIIKKKIVTTNPKIKYKGIKFGIFAGILNFTGYYFLLIAFEKGKLAVIQGIFSTSIMIPIILSVIFFKEKFDLRKVLILIFTGLVITFMKYDMIKILFG
jgi:drug/metabolite transporter (DMT)-like permease